MNDTRWTQEPWTLYVDTILGADNSLIVRADDDGKPYGMASPTLEWENENDRRHIVACVNALAGINPDAVRGLLDAAESAEKILRGMAMLVTNEDDVHAMIERANGLGAAIAKALGKVHHPLLIGQLPKDTGKQGPHTEPPPLSTPVTP